MGLTGRAALLAATTLALTALAQPSAAKTALLVIEGVGAITASHVHNTCWAEDQCTSGVPKPIGTPVNFRFEVSIDYLPGGEVTDYDLQVVDFSRFEKGRYPSSTELFANAFTFSNRTVQTGDFVVTLGDDVCGFGANGHISGKTFSYSGAYCGYDYGTEPIYYEDGVGQITRTQVFVDGHAVPEPATWALMIGGFGFVGSALRRRRAMTA